MGGIEPNPDVYGSAAQRSALADYLEVAAIYGKSLTTGELADTLEDNEWRLRNQPYVSPSGVIGDAPGGASEHDVDDDTDDGPESNFAQSANLTFQQIDERTQVLGERYPFRVDKGRLQYVGSPDEVYLFYLAISTLHAYDVSAPEPPWKAFEAAVLRSLKTAPLLSSSISHHRREGLNFSDALTAAATEIRIKARPDQMSYSFSAHDEGSDLIANYWWRDERPGHWALIGQVTCTSDSANWQKKMQEIEPTYWARGLGIANSGSVSKFLALPYHVERSQLLYLVQKCNGVLLDRLRLTACRREIESDEKLFVSKLVSSMNVFMPGDDIA